MDEGHEPERIEIELTSHEPASPTGRTGRVRGGVEDGATVETTDSDDLGRPGLLGTEPGRLVAVAAAAAVIALIVGVLVGRLGSGGVALSDDTAATTSATTTTADPDRADNTLPRAPAVLTPPPPTPPPPFTGSNTRPSSSPTTTVDPARLVVGRVAIRPEVPPEDGEVVVLAGAGEVMRIDLSSGETVSTRVEGSLNGPPSVHAGRGWVLVPMFDPGVGTDQRAMATVIFDDGSRSSVELGTGWPTFIPSGGASYWRVDIDEESGRPVRLVDVTIDGSQTGAVITLDGFYPQMADPLGGVVVQAPGGSYVLGPESRERLTSGQLIALGERRALVNECDDQLECGHFVVNRDTGARTPLVLDPSLGEHPSIEFGGWWSFREPMSPDEEALLVVTWGNSGGGRPAVGVLDLSTGEHTEIGTPIDQPQAEWSPDGRRVYWLDGGRLKVFDRSTGESVLFSDDLDRLSALALRPSIGAAEGLADDGSG